MEPKVKKQAAEVRKCIALYKRARKMALEADPYDDDRDVHMLALTIGGVMVIEETEKLLELIK